MPTSKTRYALHVSKTTKTELNLNLALTTDGTARVAKITHPLHSISVSGSIGRTVSFRATQNGSIATIKAKKYSQQSPAEIANQLIMKNARTAFLTLDAQDLNFWQQLANKYHRSAWVCFFTEYQFQQIQPPAMPLIPEPNI
jgi:hypothetical protein